MTRREPGIVKALEQTIEAWPDDDDQVIFVPNTGPLYEHLKSRGADVRAVPYSFFTEDAPTFAPHDELRRCCEALREARPDVVIVFGAATSLAHACRMLGIPIIARTAMPFLGFRPDTAVRYARALDLPLYDRIVPANDAAASLMNQIYRAPANRISAVHDGIPLDRFRPAELGQADCRRALSLPPDGAVVLCAGMLVPLKQPDLAFEAFRVLAARLPDCHLVFAGVERVSAESGVTVRIKEAAARSGLSGQVHFLGHVDHMEEVYAASDVLLHSSSEESFGLVLAEAMAMEKPVVALASDGPREIVVDGETGRLCRLPGDAAELADALLEVLGMADRGKAMGRAGRARVAERFTIARCAAELRRICCELSPDPAVVVVRR